MILSQEDTKIIRTIENRDKEEVIDMFKREDFGFCGFLADQRLSLVNEIRIIDEVLNKEELEEEYIILEIEGIIVSYACVYQDRKDRIHIGSIVTKEEYRRQGFGSHLLKFIMGYADQNSLMIKAESLTCKKLLLNLGFNSGIRSIDFIYKPQPINQIQEKYPTFLNYEGQQNKQKEKIKESKEIESFSKTLEFIKDIGIF